MAGGGRMLVSLELRRICKKTDEEGTSVKRKIKIAQLGRGEIKI